MSDRLNPITGLLKPISALRKAWDTNGHVLWSLVLISLNSLSYFLAFYIGYRFSIPSSVFASIWMTIPLVLLIKATFSYVTGEWKISPRSATAQDIHRVFLGAFLSGITIYIATIVPLQNPLSGLVPSLILIDAVLSVGFACALRVFCTLEVSGRSCDTVDFSRKDRWIYSALSLSLICLALTFYFCRLSTRPEGDLLEWFNADTLLSAHIIEDVLYEGNSLTGWKLPPAPFVFPDLIFAFLGRAVSSNPAMVTFLTGGGIFLLVSGSAIYGGVITTRHPRTMVLLISLAAGLVCLLSGEPSFVERHRLTFLYWPNFHSGTYGLALLIAAMVVQQVFSARPNFWWSLAAGILTICCGFSDLLTVVYLSAPLITALAFAWILNLITIRRTLIFIAILGVGPIVGHLLCTKFVHTVNNPNVASIATVSKAAETMMNGFLVNLTTLRPLIILACAWIVGCIIWVAYHIFAWARRRHLETVGRTESQGRAVLLLYLGLAGPATMGALIAGGCLALQGNQFGGFELALHYLQPLIYTPLLFWPLLIPESVLARMERTFEERTVMEFWAIALVGLMLVVLKVGVGERAPSKFVPEYVTRLDEIAKQHNLKHGISYHWTARHINLFSKQVSQVCPVGLGFELWPNFANEDWAKNSPYNLTRPDFVIVSPREFYSRESALSHYGPPLEEISLGENSFGRSVLIYDQSRAGVKWGKGFYRPEKNAAGYFRWCDKVAHLTIDVPTRQTIKIEFGCATAYAEKSTLTIDSPVLTSEIPVNIQGGFFSKVLTLSPGQHEFVFSTDAKRVDAPKDSRTLFFQLRDFKVSVVH